MESPVDLCFTEDGCRNSIVLEKQVFQSKVPESHVQLACDLHYCAFPLNGNELCIWNTTDDTDHQPLHLIGHHHSITALAFGNKVNPLLVCSASCDYVIVWNLDECMKKVLQGLMPQGIVIGTLLGIVLYVRFSPDDQTVAVCAGNRIYMLNTKDEAILAELEGHVAPVTAAEFCTWEKNILVSVSEDRSFKVWDYCTGLLIYQSAVITAFPLLSLFIDEENKHIITGCADGQVWIFSLISGHQYRCVVHINVKKERDKFYSKIRTSEPLDEIHNASKVYTANDLRAEETIETTFPILRIEHCDKFVNLNDEEQSFSSVNARCLWIGTSTGLFIINLANFEVEAVLHYRDYSDLSVQFAGSCALMRKAVSGKVLCLLTSMFENRIALLEINVAALLSSQQSKLLVSGREKGLSVVASCPLLPTSPLCMKKEKNKVVNKRDKLDKKSTIKDKPLVFHSKIKSSGYTSTPQMTMFSPRTTAKQSNLASKGKRSCKQNKDEYPLAHSPPTRSERHITVADKPTSVCCIQYSGDGELLACGLADKTLLAFSSNLKGTPTVYSGHDGAVNSVGWSHDKNWLVSSSEDRTLRIWSVSNAEPALCLGKEMFHKPIRSAQFYYIDTFILLSCGAEFLLLKYFLDISKDEIKRYKNKSFCKSVQKFPMASTVEITSLSAVNEFYSYIVLAAGSNRALEVFDLNAGCSAAAIPDVHSKAVHQICQNKGSAFSTQPYGAYNLFLTTAIGDGIKLWDLRTLRCERRFEGHRSRCHPCGVAVSPSGQFIACGSEDKCAYIYEIHSSTYSHKLTGHSESVINVAFSPSSPQLTTATLDGKLQLFLP
ncbi:PREDICTED: WD repeat-containing protein 27 [Gekko japonicus]|uniref:WD repeat-containing protein 27 n=1 Tax=Gekko japonicus TaxID=146911 RepID=A0ABM1KB00_GEKJA|nr:PREDICTED: WD repeat-containing protein 27 [Gekko japonicus]